MFTSHSQSIDKTELADEKFPMWSSHCEPKYLNIQEIEMLFVCSNGKFLHEILFIDLFLVLLRSQLKDDK